MSLNAFFDGLDNMERAGKFFVALTERLGDGTLASGEDAVRLARALGVTLPLELAGASIVSIDEGPTDEGEAAAGATSGSTRIVITYSDLVHQVSGQTALKLKKCFKVCQTVAGAKVCAEVCVDIKVGLSGVHGKITATVSVAF